MLCERTTEQALSERLNEYFWDGRVFEKVSQPVSARTLQLISEWSAGRRFCETFSAKSFHVRRTFKLKYLIRIQNIIRVKGFLDCPHVFKCKRVYNHVNIIPF